MADVYEQLAVNLFNLGAGYAPKEGLEEILKEMFTPLEAEVALTLPTKVAPLELAGVDDIIDKVSLSRAELVDILEGLAKRGFLFSGKTKTGGKGYALLQRGFGFPQTFFWKGESTPFAKKMVDLLVTYNRGKALEQKYATGLTRPYQFIPVNKAIDTEIQGVYTCTMLDEVIERARVIAVAHCPCRVQTQLQGKSCDHLLEVCLKFDELAEFLIDRDIARQVTREEAKEIIRKSEEDGLVHFVDNALGDIKHNCNCCCCCCWALSPIKERRIPRDLIMATYFIRETDEVECIACGNCIELCPVDALNMGDDFPVVDEAWCIGCGLCLARCSTGASRLRKKSEAVPSHDFRELHERILEEKGFR